MDAKGALRWAGYYFGVTAVFSVVGLALVGAGVYVGYQNFQATGSATAAVAASWEGVVAAVVGILVWRLGKAWAFYLTLTSAVKTDLAGTYDTEHVKSDILSVLDDRLAEMETELRGVNRRLDDLRDDAGPAGDDDAEFEFGN